VAVAVARTKDVAARAGNPPFGPQIRRFPHILGTEHAGVIDVAAAHAPVEAGTAHGQITLDVS